MKILHCHKLCKYSFSVFRFIWFGCRSKKCPFNQLLFPKYDLQMFQYVAESKILWGS